MSFIASNDRNLVDDSITEIIAEMPNAMKRITSIFVKYGKLINQKYIDFVKSDERRHIRGVNDIKCLLNLSFDKILFALDKDLYIDFMNEIKNTELDCFNFSSYDLNADFNIQRDGPGISRINFKYLVNPGNAVSKLNGYESYICDDLVPMIKVVPKFMMENVDDDICGIYNIQGNMCSSMYGIGFTVNGCEVYIDITSLFDSMSLLCNSNIHHAVNISSEDGIEIPFKNLTDENKLNRFIDLASRLMNNRVTYSLVTTYLATITKIKEFTNNEVNELFNDILNSCRKTVLDGFNSEGDDIKTGMALRHMAIDVSSLLNSISYTKKNYELGRLDEKYLLYNMLEYLLSLKYETYNYQKIPYNNLKCKKLMSITEVAKPQLYLIGPENRAALQVCALPIETESSLVKSFNNSPNVFFIPKDYIKINGTYSLNKRIYDTGKDFIDIFAKFIIIKKRMADAGGMNFADGNVDRIGKRYIDYQQYLKNTYNEIKVSLTNIFQRMKSVTLGRRTFSSNMMVKDDDRDIIKNLNTIVYGLNTECVLDEKCSTNIFDEWESRSVDYNKQNIVMNVNEKIKIIRKIYDVLKERECTYANNDQMLLTAINTYGNGSLISLWIAINECIGFFYDSPFENVKNSIGDISLGYAVNSIDEMAPKKELFNKETYENDYKTWIPVPYKASMSLEEMEQKFDEMKEKLEEQDEESVFGGMLFSDFGGMQLAQELTSKETDLYNDQISGIETDPEELKAFESLKNKFDKFLSNNI